MGQGAPHRLEISNHSNALGQFPRIGNYFNYIGYDFLGRSLFLNVTRNF